MYYFNNSVINQSTDKTDVFPKMCLVELLQCDNSKMSPLYFLFLSEQKLWFILEGLTCHYGQGQMVFVIIKPARYFHTTAVHPRVALLDLPDGQRHIPLAKITHEPVALRQPSVHWRPVWFDHLIGTASAGDGSSAPAWRKPAVVLCVIVAYQSNICSHSGNDVLCRHTTWKYINYNFIVRLTKSSLNEKANRSHVCLTLE